MGKKLLLADDSITIQKVVGIIFANEDYELSIVDNGTAALAKARESRPDIMLVDALMPGIGGYEVCEEVRRDPSLSTVPILLMTGAFEPFDEEKARRSGADDFISKPFESQQLIAKVKALLASGSTTGAVFAPAAAPVAVPQVPTPPAFDVAFEPVAVPEPIFAPPSLEPAPVPADDLWGAFQEEPAAEAMVMAEAEADGGDVFAADIFAAEPVVETAAPSAAPVLDEETARMFRPSFEPMDEQTFSFDEPGEPTVIGRGGDFAFGLDATPPELAVFAEEPPLAMEEIPAVEAAPVFVSEPVIGAMAAAAVEPVAAVAPQPAAQAPAFTEEQLRTALAAASKEVIERIVWEVVPDLAETMIAEAIRRIKEGR
jgi:CheY-like chemotaxis protein